MTKIGSEAFAGALSPAPSFLYAGDMAGQKSPSVEELVRLHNIVDSPIAAWDLDSGMILRVEGRLRIVISVSYENTESGPVVVVESLAGLKRFASDAQLDVWHVNGEPFILDLPPEELGAGMPPPGRGGSSPPAHDAAGIVPVRRGPKKLS
jgi:hypothetical protein